MGIEKIYVRVPANKREELLALAKEWRASSEMRSPGWDAKEIHRIAEEKFGDLEGMFKHYGWPERGSKMMPKVQSRICEAYGSIESFVQKYSPKTKNAQIGDISTNRQKLINKTKKPSTTHFNQKIWVVACQKCEHVYGVNGCDFHERKCPECMDGQPGEPLFPFGILGPLKHENEDTDNMVRPADDDLLDEMGL